jgi:hypothetical protein
MLPVDKAAQQVVQQGVTRPSLSRTKGAQDIRVTPLRQEVMARKKKAANKRLM